MTDADTFETFVLRIAQTARELGVDQERTRILRLIDDLTTATPGGPELKDRIIRAITSEAESHAA